MRMSFIDPAWSRPKPKRTLFGVVVLVIFLGQELMRAGVSSATSKPSWNPQKAADYLDRRERWWTNWPNATRDEGTFCISCHTAVPYALARPALRQELGEELPADNEKALLSNVRKRVRLWNRIGPFYGGGHNGQVKATESRATEAVLNALVLASSEAATGSLTSDTQSAFDDMWALQVRSGSQRGAWPWLNFGNEPFEASDSTFYGASLAAVAAGTAPEHYRDAAAVRESLSELFAYLNRESSRQSALNRVVLLWASARLPGLLDKNRRQSILDEIRNSQQAGGGWSLASLAWNWKSSDLFSLLRLSVHADSTPMNPKADGYATGLVVFALEQIGFSRDDPGVRRGLAWLEQNQNPDGSWHTDSLNKHREVGTPVERFMSDAATAYAVLRWRRTLQWSLFLDGVSQFLGMFRVVVPRNSRRPFRQFT